MGLGRREKQSLNAHLFRPRYGRLEIVHAFLPWGFELIEAFVEVLGYFCIVAAWLTGGLNVANFLPVIV